MDKETREFFHRVLEKVVPSLTHDGREALINRVLLHLFDHPWQDDDLKASIINNLFNDLWNNGIEVDAPEIPEQFNDEDAEAWRKFQTENS